MKRLEKKHSLPTRVFHWLNVPLLAIMIWSGLLIYWANDVYRIGLGNVTLFHFFPDWFYNAFNIAPSAGGGHGLALFLHVVLRDQRAAVRRLYIHLRRMAAFAAEPPHAARSARCRAARFASEQEAVAAAEIQRRPAAGVHGRRADGARLAASPGWRFTSRSNSPGSPVCSAATKWPAGSIFCWSSATCCFLSFILPK